MKNSIIALSLFALSGSTLAAGYADESLATLTTNIPAVCGVAVELKDSNLSDDQNLSLYSGLRITRALEQKLSSQLLLTYVMCTIYTIKTTLRKISRYVLTTKNIIKTTL